MKTTISAIKTIHGHLISKGAKAATGISGNIYWLNRPKNSNKEDIVVNAIGMNALELQEGVFNVNIHVPNLVLSNDDTQPDLNRFNAIAEILTPMLTDVWGPDWNFTIEEPATPVPDGKYWFCNIRIRFYTIRN